MPESHVQDDRAAALLTLAQRVACDMHDDIHTVWRLIAGLDRADLEALCCVLAAMVRLDQPVLPWWQWTADGPDVVAQRQRDLVAAMATG